jgi:hypothetical protein
MRSRSSFHEGGRLFLLLLCVAVPMIGIACSEPAESGDPALVVQVLDDAVTVENRTGTSLSKAELSIIPQGIPRPYTALVGRLSSGEKRSFALTAFRMDGTPFRRGIANGRRVRLTGVDPGGKAYQREVAFK